MSTKKFNSNRKTSDIQQIRHHQQGHKNAIIVEDDEICIFNPHATVWRLRVQKIRPYLLEARVEEIVRVVGARTKFGFFFLFFVFGSLGKAKHEPKPSFSPKFPSPPQNFWLPPGPKRNDPEYFQKFHFQWSSPGVCRRLGKSAQRCVQCPFFILVPPYLPLPATQQMDSKRSVKI